jgi:PAS domain S-box-containing protein
MKTARIHVLIAEDDAAHVSAIRRAFEAAGPETVIEVVGTLREFRQRSVEKPPNIAVLDLNLPDGRAVEMLAHPPEAGPFPILVMTSFGNEQVAVQALKSGALDYVVKSPEAFAGLPHIVTRALHEWSLLQERRQAEEALAFKNLILTTQQETSLDGILVVDANGGIISFNRRFVEIWEIPADVAESKSDERVLQSVMDKLAQPEEFVGKLEHLHAAREETSQDEIALKDGRIFDRYSAPMLGADGQYSGRVWYFRDITKRRQFEVALREEEEWFRSVFEHASDGLFFLSENFEIISVNESFAAMHGYRVAEILKMTLKELDLQEGRHLSPERMRRILAGESLTFEVDHRHKQGHLFPLEVTANLVTMGRKKYILASHRDITERKRAEAALRAEERRYQTLSEISPVGIFRTDAQGQTTYVNPRWCQITGLSAADGLGEGWLRTVHPQDREQVTRGWHEAIQDPRSSTADYRFVHPDGTVAWVMGQAVPEKDHAGRVVGYVGTITDVTERKRAEEALRLESAALDAAANAIVITDRAGIIQWANPAFTSFTGYAVAEAAGKNPSALIKSGKHEPAFYKNMWDTILGGQVWRGEIINRRKDGGFYTEEMTITPVRDQRGEITHFVAIKQDVTEKKMLESRLLRSQRLESVGRLASGIAHDLNNILAPMLMSAPVLREAISDPDIRQLVDTIESSAVRGAGVIKQLLTFSRGVEGERVPVQLKSLVMDMLNIIRETFPKNIIAAREAPASPWLVRGDATQLHQILMNLCVNARDAMPGGGKLTLELENIEVNEAVASMNPGASPGRYVALGVTDTGTGISPENLDKIFEPFFTTKEVGQGTGLGLSTVIGIVKSHGGFIQVNSRMGQGTQFKVYLPACETPKDGEKKQKPDASPQGRGELVLLVDDEESIRRVARQTLERHGYRMIEASDGAQGLAQYTQHQSEVRLVITDVVMPFMDGPAFIRALRQLNPQIRIIAMSGHQSKASAGHLPPKLVQGLLAKPFDAAELLQTLKQALRH